MSTDSARVVEVARAAALAGGVAAMKHFRSGVRVETKPDRSPVTAADRESEAAIRALIRDAFPDHAVLGEEGGVVAGAASGRRWIVDPLDGTRGFTRGGAFWGPLIAYEEEGQVIAGAMRLPVAGVSYWAGRGLGAFRDGERLRVSDVASWDQATVQFGELKALLAPPWQARVLGLIGEAWNARDYGDLAGFAALLDGRADAWLEAGVQVWDLAPLRILVEEAGGVFTDLHGAATIESGHALATNGKLHPHALAALAR